MLAACCQAFNSPGSVLRIAGRESPCNKQPGPDLDSAEELMCLGPRELLRKCSPRCRDGEKSAWLVASNTASRELLLGTVPSSQPSPLLVAAGESTGVLKGSLCICYPASSLVLSVSSNGVIPAVTLCSSVASCWLLRPEVSGEFPDGSRANVLSCSSSLGHQQPLLSLMQ